MNGAADRKPSAASAAHVDVNPLLADALLAAHHDTLLDWRRDAGINGSAFALFAGGRRTAGSTLTAVSLRE